MKTKIFSRCGKTQRKTMFLDMISLCAFVSSTNNIIKLQMSLNCNFITVPTSVFQGFNNKFDLPSSLPLHTAQNKRPKKRFKGTSDSLQDCGLWSNHYIPGLHCSGPLLVNVFNVGLSNGKRTMFEKTCPGRACNVIAHYAQLITSSQNLLQILEETNLQTYLAAELDYKDLSDELRYQYYY